LAGKGPVGADVDAAADGGEQGGYLAAV